MRDSKMRRQVKGVALKATYYSGVYRLISLGYSGMGTIFAMHKVVRAKTDSLAIGLTITVDFLDRVLAHLRSKVDFITLDEVHERLTRDAPAKLKRPFIAMASETI
jgi:hypothetical protein